MSKVKLKLLKADPSTERYVYEGHHSGPKVGLDFEIHLQREQTGFRVVKVWFGDDCVEQSVDSVRQNVASRLERMAEVLRAASEPKRILPLSFGAGTVI